MSKPKDPPRDLSEQDKENPVVGKPGRLGHWMEEAIQEAQRRGDFDDLPGKGKPLKLRDTDPFGGPEADIYRILKDSGFTPEWVDLRKIIVAEINWLRQNNESPERVSRIVETNILIDRHNRAVPTPALALPKLPRTFPD